jgi:chitodextrinase
VASGTTPDTQAPTVPKNLTATAMSGSQINLSWTASTDNVGVTGYRVERCQGAGCNNFAQIGTAAGTTYNDSGLTANTSYSYRVRATDAAGNLSPYSNVASATTQSPDTQPPTAPTNLTATAISGSQINLSWTASTDNVGVTGYLVERCQGAGCNNFAQIGTGAGTTYNDTGLTNAISYSYRVRATDAAGNLSSYSSVASATTTANTGLVAAYSFNEGAGTTVIDSSGQGNTGTITNATWTSSGKYGSAMVFNGTNAWVTISDAASLHLTSGMTLEAWVNPSTVSSAWRDVMYKGNDMYYLEGTSDNGTRTGGGGTFGSIDAVIYGNAALTVNTWAHLALTYDGANLRLYVNGTQVSSQAQTGNIATSTNPLQIGGDNIYGQYFAGTIDEIRVYNTALTQSQIQSDMVTPVP